MNASGNRRGFAPLASMEDISWASEDERLIPEPYLDQGAVRRDVYVRRSKTPHSNLGLGAGVTERSFPHSHFRAIDNSLSDLNRPCDRSRIMRKLSSTSTASYEGETALRAAAIETSFCGPKPPIIMSPYQPSMEATPIPNIPGKKDIKPSRPSTLPKQDSYAAAIYNAHTSRSVVKQGSYEVAIAHSGLSAKEAIKRNKELLRIRKQDSYARAIGGSFEESFDSSSNVSGTGIRGSRSPMRMRKQESFLKAVGEHDDFNDKNDDKGGNRGRVRKQDSYLRAIGALSIEQQQPVLSKQSSYQRAVLDHSILSEEALLSPEEVKTHSHRSSMRRQESYNRAVEEFDSDGNPKYERILRVLQPKEIRAQNWSQRREDSYLEAMQSEPVIMRPKRKKVRQDSYQAMDHFEINDNIEEKKQQEENLVRERRDEKTNQVRRQQSYTQAMVHFIEDKPSKPIRRQDSYQRAIDIMDEDEMNNEELLNTSTVMARELRRIDTESLSSMEEQQVAHPFLTDLEQYPTVVTPPLLQRDVPHQDLESAATRIQSLFRGHKERNQLQEANEAATKIQSLFRGHQERKNGRRASLPAAMTSNLNGEEQQAATLIQAAVKGRLARRQLQEQNRAATRIQALVRGSQTRKNFKNDLGMDEMDDLGMGEMDDLGMAKMDDLGMAKMDHLGMAKICQGDLAIENEDEMDDLGMAKMDDLGMAKMDEDEKESDAATRIQALYRGRQTRKEQVDRKEAASTIQSAFRDFNTRRHNTKTNSSVKRLIKQESLPMIMIDDVKNEDDAVLTIQAAFKGFVARKEYKQQKEAASVIQRAFKKRKASLAIALETNSNTEEVDTEEEEAATRIQAMYRGYQERKVIQQENRAAARIQRRFRAFQKDRKGFIDSSSSTTESSSSRTPSGSLDLEEEEVAATKIQAAFKGMKQRREINKNKEAATKIQKVFRGHQVRKKQQEGKGIARQSSLPDIAPEESFAVVKLQAAFRGLKVRKELKQSEEPKVDPAPEPSEDEAEMELAATKIQSVFKGSRDRRALQESKEAATKIQSMYRGYQVRKDQEKDKKLTHQTSLPDIAPEETFAVVKLQSAFRGLKVRRELKASDWSKMEQPEDEEELARAATRIQSVFKGSRDRKALQESGKAATKIQSVFRGHQVRKRQQEDKKFVHQSSLPDIAPEEGHAVVKLQAAFRGLKVRKELKQNDGSQIKQEQDRSKVGTNDTLRSQSVSKGQNNKSSNVLAEDERKFTDMQSELKDVLARRNAALMMAASSSLPRKVDFGETMQVPRSEAPRRASSIQMASKALPSDELLEEPSKELLMHPGDLVAAAITIQRFFRRLRLRAREQTRAESSASTHSSSSESKESTSTEEHDSSVSTGSSSSDSSPRISPPPPPSSSQNRSDDVNTFGQKGQTDRRMSASLKSSASQKDEPLSSTLISQQIMRNRSSSPLPPISSKLKEVSIPSIPEKSNESMTRSAFGLIRKSSLGAFFNMDDQNITENTSNTNNNVKSTANNEGESKGFFSSLLRRGTKSKEPEKEAAPELEADLIHVVLKSVEDNWLNQAPQPTLDKKEALEGLEASEECEAILRANSPMGDLPFLETTLPQERNVNVVSITPSHQRIDQCRLINSVKRPRSASPSVRSSVPSGSASLSEQRIRIRLPSSSEAKARIRPEPETWEQFASRGLATFKSKHEPPPVPERTRASLNKS